jgi:hypothetical protein
MEKNKVNESEQTWMAIIENAYGENIIENIILGTFHGVDRKTVLDRIVAEQKCSAEYVKLYRLVDDSS